MSQSLEIVIDVVDPDRQERSNNRFAAIRSHSSEEYSGIRNHQLKLNSCRQHCF